MVFSNVDYYRFADVPSVEASFRSMVRSKVAAATNVSEDFVSIELSPGSVKVEARVTIPNGAPVADLMDVFERRRQNLTAELVAATGTIDLINTVTTGEITLDIGALRGEGETLTSTTTLTFTTNTTTTTEDRDQPTTTVQDLQLGTTRASPFGFIPDADPTLVASVGGSVIALVLLSLCIAGLCCVRVCRRSHEEADDQLGQPQFEAKDRMGLEVVVDPTTPSQSPFSGPGPAPEPSPSYFSQSPNNPEGDTPGRYEIVIDYTAVGPEFQLGAVTAELELETIVQVVEVAWNRAEHRVRGRITYPPGWISLYSTEEGDDRRWARQLDASPAQPATPVTPYPVPSAQYFMQQAAPAAGQLPRPRSPGLSPASVSPAGASPHTPQQLSPAGGLPGGYHAGDPVVALLDFSGNSGHVSQGERGVVVGPCKGYTGQKAESRVNCKFPRHPNINLKVTQIRRVDGAAV